MKNAVFFSRPRRYGRFFGRCRNHQNGGQKSPPENTQTDAKSHVLSAFPVKKVTNIGSHDGMVRWGLPSTIAHEHQKSDSSTVR